jgi:hypothetical protein
MTCIAGALRRLTWALCVCVLLPHAGAQAAERSVLADFDGDGQHDRATLDHREPSVLRIYLSATNSTAVVRSQVPIAGIAALDLDGDRRAELIAGGASSGLQVWTTHRKGFRAFRPQTVTPEALGPPLRHNVEQGAGDAPVAITSAPPSPTALAVSPQPRPPTTTVASPLATHTADPHSPQQLAPLAPRPPPASL